MMRCDLYLYSNSWHLAQVLAGFRELHRMGALRIIENIGSSPSSSRVASTPWERSRDSLLRVVLNGETVLCYDTHDSDRLDEQALEEVDYYFKRGFLAEHRRRHNGAKVFPLGLFYPVYSTSPDFSRARRVLAFASGFERLKRLIKSLVLQEQRNVRDFVPLPRLTQVPRVLFLARVWDPMEVECHQWRHDREQLNDMRVRCIRALRRELGTRFVGGLEPTEFAVKAYPDCIAENPQWCRHYLAFQRGFPIGVATTGLHGSIGCKFAEYVAQAKAIVSEPLRFEVPGDLAPDSHYLEFSSPEHCVEAAVCLIEDHSLRIEQMINNYRYYHAYLRPDSLVLKTLAIAISSTAAKRAEVMRSIAWGEF